jgi:hypothetical protein
LDPESPCVSCFSVLNVFLSIFVPIIGFVRRLHAVVIFLIPFLRAIKALYILYVFRSYFSRTIPLIRVRYLGGILLELYTTWPLLLLPYNSR